MSGIVKYGWSNEDESCNFSRWLNKIERRKGFNLHSAGIL
jgi:hypothetical protein